MFINSNMQALADSFSEDNDFNQFSTSIEVYYYGALEQYQGNMLDVENKNKLIAIGDFYKETIDSKIDILSDDEQKHVIEVLKPYKLLKNIRGF
tara:strand:- start:8695 stop:8976 length:282 start_codon:yes stop_codon:yes gene_type:complete